jgi:hypothetical protein
MINPMMLYSFWPKQNNIWDDVNQCSNNTKTKGQKKPKASISLGWRLTRLLYNIKSKSMRLIPNAEESSNWEENVLSTKASETVFLTNSL